MIYNNITNKIALGVIHCPDMQKNIYWDKICKLNNNKTFKSTPELKIITWNNIPHKGLFENKCLSNGLDIDIYGKEIQKWSNYLKFKFNIEAACNTKCPYIMGCDSHDAILLNSPEIILNKFKTYNCKLLFNGELKFFPDIDEINVQKWKKFQQSIAKTKFAFLNAGAWIGERDFVINFFESCWNTKINDLYNSEKYFFSNSLSTGCDQSIIHSKFEEFHPKIQINYDADLFLNIANFKTNDLSFVYKFL